MNVEEKIRSIVVDYADTRPCLIDSDTSFQHDLGVDSLGIVEVVMACEE